MFLKRIELQGFKSFADKTIIHFDHAVCGIVGPNGCGKSNINDAIRWVLGEQSAKSLRSENMSRVIFAGSQHRNAVNMAEVTLVFDNSKRHLQIEFDEVEITRRLHRNSGEGEYFINRTPCRLKDIHNLVMDSGLGRDSLSVISQGNISSFADAKPEDRRALFEEAAGVAKYKKRKNESLNKLNRTQTNLERVEDIIHELEPRIVPLKRQALKAQTYMEKKAALEKVEISVIVDEVQSLQEQIEDLQKDLFEFGSQTTIAEASIQIEENKNMEAKVERNTLDKEVDKYQKKFVSIVNEISALEARKIEVDEKRKYALEHASAQEKLKQLTSLLNETKFEYENRLQRFESMKTDLSLARQSESDCDSKIQQIETQLQQNNIHLNRLSNRNEVLDNLIKTPFNHQEGVKAIMNAKQSLVGIHGVISQLLKPLEGYEVAISNALGAALYHIVSEDSDSARHAISYLKKNQSGRATFLPLSVLKDRVIEERDFIICEHSEGFLGSANQFVASDAQYTCVSNSLLGNVLICDELKHANELASLLKHRYKIITLEGDVVHKGGSISGGKIKGQYSPLTLEKEKKDILKTLDETKQKVNKLEDELITSRQNYEQVKQNVMNTQLNMAQLQPVLEAKKAAYFSLQDECNELGMQTSELEEGVETDDLVIQLSASLLEKDMIEVELASMRERRSKLGMQIESRESTIRNTRRDLNIALQLVKEKEILIAKKETSLDNVLQRLASTYEMTYEYACTLKENINLEEARQEVLILRTEISKLGNVNLEAPKEYEEVNERYTTLNDSRNELLDARDKILAAIDEMDEVMERQFMDMFDKINNQLDETFKSLFGGGKATLFLSNPEEPLTSGIEINAQPPGKAVESMSLLSGGEKSMLAMCVLFAILKVRTMPLCIFDEVEAALDQANVERFAKYIAKFKGDSQFIIVTHRPGTMAQCEALYGVTMKQNGVSQFLKVNLQDALGYVDKEEVKV